MAAVVQTSETTVVVGQVGQTDGKQQNVNQFTTGICGCFEDCGGCVFAYFCFPCYICTISGKMKESCMVHCLGSPYFMYLADYFYLFHLRSSELGLMLMRTKLRTAYGISGSICGDCVCATFCTECTACQIDRELNARGINIF